jgi:hypothetical protein
MSQTMKPLSSILMDTLKSLKSEVKKNVDKEKLVKKFTGWLSSSVKNYGKAQGVIAEEGIVDTQKSKAGEEGSDSSIIPVTENLPEKQPEDTPTGWFALLRYRLNIGFMELAKSVKLEKVGNFLTMDLKTRFNLDERDMNIVEMYRNIGNEFAKITKFPIIGPVIEEVAALLGATACKLATNRKFIIETEFARENLEELISFGMRHEKLETIANQLFDRLNELDRGFASQVSENDALKVKVFQNIASAHARVNLAIDETRGKLEKEADIFDADMKNVINNI